MNENNKTNLKDLITHRSSSFSRKYEGFCYMFPDENPAYCIIKAVLNDPHHDVILYLKVNLGSAEIQDLQIDFERMPFPLCRDSIKNYTKAIGLSLSERKIKKFLLDFERANCLHINELFMTAVSAYINGYAFYLKDKHFPPEYDEYKMHIGDLPLEQRLELNRHWWMHDKGVKGTCYAYLPETEKAEFKEKIKKLPTITRLMVQEMKKNR